MLEQPRQQQQDELMAQLQKRMAALEQENTLLRQRLADLSELEQRYRLLENRDRILEATVSASNALLTIENFDEAVNTALQIIGEKLDSDRVAVIENLDSPPDELPRWKVVYEWHSPHTLPQISHPNVAQGSYEEIKEWYALFSKGEGVSCLLEEMPEPFRSGQAELSVKAFHIVPIFVEGECWGVVGFDDCREAKRRSLAELAVLKTAAACIGSAIEGDRTQQALLRAEQERATQLEDINTELRQALDQLAESEERFRTLFELSSEGFNYVEFDPPYSVTLPIEEQCELYRRNLRVVKVNPAFAAMYGVDNPDDLIGLKITDVHVEDSHKNAAFIRAVVENGYRARNIETEEIDIHGQLHYFLNSGVATIKDNYVVNGWATQVDITQLRQTQQALLRAEQERAAELAKVNEELRQRDRLLSTVADIAKDLLENPQVDSAIERVLRKMGEAAGISRVTLMREEPEVGTGRMQHHVLLEWTAPSVPRQSDDPLTKTLYNDEYGILVDELHAGHSIWHVLEELPEPARTQQESIAVKSTGAVSIFIEGKYFGCVAFDDCMYHRQWSNQEIDVLTSGAGAIGAALHRKQLTERLIEERTRAAQERAAELAKVNEELRQRDRLLSAVAQITKDLLEAEDVALVIPAALQAVGEAANMSRVQLILEHQELSMQKRQHIMAYEWVAAGITAQIGNPDLAIIDNDEIEVLLRELYAGRSVWRIVDDLPDILREKFSSIGIKSTGTVPIFIEGRYIGCVAFDDCITPRHWTQQEIDVLTAAAEIIGAALHRKQLIERLIEERTKAAQEQAAKLESVNAVLHESVKQLSNEADTEVFLGYVLAEMARQVDAALVHLFRYDASDHTLTLHLTYLKGKLRQGTSNEECELFAAPFPTDITPAFELMCQHRQFMTPEATPIPVEEFAWPGALEWLANIQASDAAHMVLFVGDTPVGTMGLAFTDGKTLQKEDQPLVMALAQQCAIALRLSDLAERSRQAAIAREQQKAALERATELESLNAALRHETRERCQAEEVIRSQNSALKHSLERLLQEPDIRGFLGALLDTLITQLQGHAANIWLLQDDRTTLTLWTAFALEQLHTNPEETLLPYEPIPVDLIAQTILSVKAGWQETIHYSGDDPRLPLPLQEFHKRDRICSVLTTPLRLGHHLLGWLAFATQEDLQQMPSDKVAFLEAIAHQATLAVHLHHLAEEAKQAAIAREQEKAAQERAAELAKANHALRESLGSLASNPELDTFLGYMLLEMATQIDAVKNYLFLYDQSTDTLSLHTFVCDGKVFSKEANDFEPFAQPIPADMPPTWRVMIQQKSPLNLAVEPDNASFWSGTYEWHRTQGHQAVLCVPLILGEEPLGFLGLAFTEKAMLSPQEIELAQALAHQVTLAIQLTRLAEESRQTAILEERNRMAREIHDTLAQAFAGIGMQLQAANRFRTTNPHKAQIHCDRAYALAQTGLTEARRSVWALSQEGLEYSDLSVSVTRIVEQLTAETSLQADIEVQGTPYSVEPEVGLNLLRIAQEALTNALRHAQAQTIQIQITYEPSYVRLGVRDDGRGFDPQLPVKGFGLASMQQRADHIGAQLLVSSQLGAGTEIAVILPMGE